MRVGRVSEFNDPFEWRLGFTGIVPEGEEVVEMCMLNVIRELSSVFGVICFTDLVKDPVLWSHYADHHRGVAFECDYTITAHLHKVLYTDDRPVIDARMLNNPIGLQEDLLALAKKMISQKALSWSYEREYRVHVPLSECQIGGGHYFQRIPNSFLTRVILGYRCQLEEGYVRKALDLAGLFDTKVVRARMEQASYKIQC